MTRVHVVCEGQTEVRFVEQVLMPHFVARSTYLSAVLIGRPGHKGGNLQFERLLHDLKKLLLGDRDAYTTTFFDFYGLPSNFPGREQAAKQLTAQAKATYLLEELSTNVEWELGADALRRFIPYVQMHEFEGLLFSDPQAFAAALNRADLLEPLRMIRDGVTSPEEINDSPNTAPSKRLKRLFDGYQKPLHGIRGALGVGLQAIRDECEGFRSWIEQLEALGDGGD